MRLAEYNLFKAIIKLIRRAYEKGTIRQVYVDEKNMSARAESKNYTWELKLISRDD